MSHESRESAGFTVRHWRELYPGAVPICILYSSTFGAPPERGTDDCLSTLLHIAGVSDAGVEELHPLDGEMWINERKLLPGDCSCGAPGMGDDRVWTETGCTCVLITSTPRAEDAP